MVVPDPKSCGLIRPSAVTAVASVNTSGTANGPASQMNNVQSFANPSVLEYWHIGDTKMRCGRQTAQAERIEEDEASTYCYGKGQWLMADG